MGIVKKPTALSQRFLSKVDKRGENECWEWLANKNASGYGKIRANGRRGHILFAHRVSYELARGSIPNTLCVLHCCDNPGCVNPGHLFLGTQLDNIADMTSKGRSSRQRGEANGRSKLSSGQIKKIRASAGILEDIARKFGTSRSNVSLIKRQESWRHI